MSQVGACQGWQGLDTGAVCAGSNQGPAGVHAKLPCPLAVVLLPYLPTTNRTPWPPLVQERQMGGYRAEERLVQVGGFCCRPARRAASASTPAGMLARPAAPVHQPRSPYVSAACQLLPSSLLHYSFEPPPVGPPAAGGDGPRGQLRPPGQGRGRRWRPWGPGQHRPARQGVPAAAGLLLGARLQPRMCMRGVG